MNKLEIKLQLDIIKNCEPDMYTPLWETISFIEHLYPNIKETEKIEVGKKVITDLVSKKYLELYLGSAYSENQYEIIKESETEKILNIKEYWYSGLAQERYIE